MEKRYKVIQEQEGLNLMFGFDANRNDAFWILDGANWVTRTAKTILGAKRIASKLEKEWQCFSRNEDRRESKRYKITAAFKAAGLEAPAVHIAETHSCYFSCNGLKFRLSDHAATSWRKDGEIEVTTAEEAVAYVLERR